MATGQKAKQKIVRTASGLKRARQAIKENARNSSLRSKLRTAIKSVRKAVAAGDAKVAAETFRSAQQVIDTIADKKIVHKNKASRDKSRLAAAVKGITAAA
jgi:small subunit ribosomal protein S20